MPDRLWRFAPAGDWQRRLLPMAAYLPIARSTALSEPLKRVVSMRRAKAALPSSVVRLAESSSSSGGWRRLSSGRRGCRVGSSTRRGRSVYLNAQIVLFERQRFFPFPSGVAGKSRTGRYCSQYLMVALLCPYRSAYDWLKAGAWPHLGVMWPCASFVCRLASYVPLHKIWYGILLLYNNRNLSKEVAGVENST